MYEYGIYKIDVSRMKLICGVSAKFYYLQPGVETRSKIETVNQFTLDVFNKMVVHDKID